MQVMRIRQRDDRYRNKKKKKQQQQQGASAHNHQAKQLPEPAYRRKPNPIRRYDTDVLSPVSLSVCPAYFCTFRFRTSSCLRLLYVSASSRATSRVSETGRCRLSPSRAGCWAEPTLWWMWATALRRRSLEQQDLRCGSDRVAP